MNNKPVAEFRDGTIKVAVWENQTNQGRTFYTFEPSQSYKDQGDNWQQNAKMTGADAIRAANLLTRAYNWSLTAKANQKAQG